MDPLRFPVGSLDQTAFGTIVAYGALPAAREFAMAAIMMHVGLPWAGGGERAADEQGIRHRLVSVEFLELPANDGRRDLQRFVTAFDNRHTVAIEPQLRKLEAPTLIVWALDDIYFGAEWAKWLKDTIPGAKEPILIDGARLFFPEERPTEFNRLLREFWAAT